MILEGATTRRNGRLQRVKGFPILARCAQTLVRACLPDLLDHRKNPRHPSCWCRRSGRSCHLPRPWSFSCRPSGHRTGGSDRAADVNVSYAISSGLPALSLRDRRSRVPVTSGAKDTIDYRCRQPASHSQFVSPPAFANTCSPSGSGRTSLRHEGCSIRHAPSEP